MNEHRFKHLVFLVPFVLLSLLSCAPRHSPNQKDSTVHHIILFWLDEPGDPSTIQLFTDTSKSFTEIPGILEVVVGTSLPGDRPVVDDSFDVAVLFTFADEQAYHDYLTHPLHLKAVKEIIGPHVRKMQIYNVSEPPPEGSSR